MKLVLLVLALVVVYLLTRTESFQEGLNGELVEQKTQISPDQNQQIIAMTQKELKDRTGLCGYCIETNKIQKYGRGSNPADFIIKARYMFLIFSTYPYGLAVDVEIENDKIKTFSTQPAGEAGSTGGQFVAYTDEVAHEFVSYDQLAQKPSPILLNDTQK
jgi:hypothetical protein